MPDERGEFGEGKDRGRSGPVRGHDITTRSVRWPMTDAEYLWEPDRRCWSVRRHADGPGVRATQLVGAGDWGRDPVDQPHPVPPPFTTNAWRLTHLAG